MKSTCPAPAAKKHKVPPAVPVPCQTDSCQHRASMEGSSCPPLTRARNSGLSTVPWNNWSSVTCLEDAEARLLLVLSANGGECGSCTLPFQPLLGRRQLGRLSFPTPLGLDRGPEDSAYSRASGPRGGKERAVGMGCGGELLRAGTRTDPCEAIFIVATCAFGVRGWRQGAAGSRRAPASPGEKGVATESAAGCVGEAVRCRSPVEGGGLAESW